MFVFDVETLGKESNAVILSLACIHFDPANFPSPKELKENAFFVKFNAQDQVKRLKRSMTKSSLDWWAKQCLNARTKSFKPSDDDVLIEDGLAAFKVWADQYREPKSWVFARGNLDQLVLDSIEEQLGLEPVFFYNRWRDIRTAVDFLYDTDNGYCDVEYEGFDSFLHITKHDPVDDCILDAMMLVHGVKKK